MNSPCRPLTTVAFLLLLAVSPFARQAPQGGAQTPPAGRGERGRGGGDPFAG